MILEVYALLFSFRSLFLLQSYGVLVYHPKNINRLSGSKMMPHEHDVNVPNRGNGERGPSGAGSGVGREGSGEQVQRVAVPGEWEAGKVGKA